MISKLGYLGSITVLRRLDNMFMTVPLIDVSNASERRHGCMIIERDGTHIIW